MTSEKDINKVLLLKKTLYSLKQSDKQWFTKLDEKLKSLGLVQWKQTFICLDVYITENLLMGISCYNICWWHHCCNEPYWKF